ncbi:MAG: hypothetical protein IJL70_08280, partial [Treponema sp.]|nr:hypothetical protein [Treponema sp.]
DQQIAYTNAPSVSVYLKADAEQGEFLSDGEKTFKVGYDTEVQFTVNQESYVFEKLEAVVRNSPETSRTESVQFTEVESDAKKGIYKINVKVLKQVSDIMIRPVCTLLPKISSISPALETNGCNQDSAITIVFNKNMNPESFGDFSGLSITSNGIPVNDYFATPEFFNNNTTLSILPLAATDPTKLLLPPDEATEIREIQVSYIFTDETDLLGNHIKGNLEHKYRINKEFEQKKTVKVLVEADAEQGKFLSAGLTDCTVNYTFDIQFTVKKSVYSFKDFEAVSRDDNSQSRMSSVAFENKEYDDESGVYKARVRVKDTPENSDILIRPVCTLLPKISSISPALEANGCNQDSEITIAFNKKMDPASFKDTNGKITGLSITNGDDEDLSAYFDEPFFTSDNQSLCLQPLCITDNTKYLLAPDGSKNSLNIEVGYTFVDVKDEDGLAFTVNGSHNYKINKNFNKQEEVTVRVENPNTAYGSFLSAGEKQCIVGFGFEIEFTLNKESYVFEDFEALGQNDESRASYVSFDNMQFDEETGICKAKVRVVQAADDIIIRPKCTLIKNAEVTIYGKEGVKSISPASGTTVQSFIKRNYSIRFTPDDDYEFIRWVLYDINTGEEIPNETYVTITEPYESETSYEVTQVPANSIKLGLRAAVVERPQLISNTPQNGGILKDSTIQVLFDRAMDEYSIYYTDDEIDELLALGVKKDEFLPEIPTDLQNNYGYHYGYTKNGETYLKNISLTNNKDGTNLNDKFDAPFFENARTLSIPASKENGKTLDDYTQVLVSIEKGFFYSEKIDETTSKPVTLRGIKKWSYQVTNHGDEDALVFQKKNGNDLFTLKLENTESAVQLSDTNAQPTIGNDGNGISSLNFLKIKKVEGKQTPLPTLYCYMELQDVTGGSGPNSTFTICYERIKEGDYLTAGQGENVTGSFGHEYTATTSQDAFFKGDLSLDLPADGLYRIWFDFTDRSQNHFYYPANANEPDSKVGFYVVKDTGIDMADPIITDTSDKNDIKLKLEWEPCIDLKSTKIRYKKKSDNWSDSYDNFAKTTKYKLYDSLALNTEYDFEIINTDYAGNTQITNFSPKTADYTGITISGTPEKTVYLKGEVFDKSGLTMTASLTKTDLLPNGVSWDVSDCHDFSSSEICFNGKTVTVSYTVAGVEKTAAINAKYYVAAADALTQSPVKLTDYTGTLSGGVYYKFGDFPQTISAITGDNAYSSQTVYNGWYLGSDGYFYAKCTENAWDDKYTYSNGIKCAKSSANSEKYFKVEPIVWRVLNPSESGNKILLAEKILTAIVQYYGSTENRNLNGTTIYANNYTYSNIRAYLNGTANQFVTNGGTATIFDIDWSGKGFLQSAFTSTAQKLIETTWVDNSKGSTNPASNSRQFNGGANEYACTNTSDKIFLLSEKEATTTSYGFDAYNSSGAGNTRIRVTTDYAKANYAAQNTTSGYGGYWWLRSPSHDERYNVRYVGQSGLADCYYYSARDINGIVPALCVDSSKLSQ